MTTLTNKAYELRQDSSQLKGYTNDEYYDGWVVDFPGWEQVNALFWEPQPIKLPLEFRLEGRFSRILHTDYPCFSPYIPVMSEKMLKVLLSVQPFPHQAIPVVIYDGDSTQETRDYTLVQLLKHIDVFDPEHSEYYQNSGLIDCIALKEPVGGYPPLFRVIEEPTFLFVSAQAKAALQKAGIRGVSFISLVAT